MQKWFKDTADSMKEYVKKNPENGAFMLPKIKVYEFMATCSEEETLEIFNSSVFNDVVKGYVLKAADTLEYTQEQRTALFVRITRLFDEMSAGEAKKYWYDN